jgi:hypothetical protein
VVPDTYADFFVASAGVAGALVGLLFVALSVAREPKTAVDRLDLDARAGVAFSAFTDALVVSLFAIIPGVKIGIPAVVSGLGGLATCLAIGLVMWRLDSPGRRRLRALGLQALVFVYQIVTGVQLIVDPNDGFAIRTTAGIVVALFLVGIARAWALIGARGVGLSRAIRDAVRGLPIDIGDSDSDSAETTDD